MRALMLAAALSVLLTGCGSMNPCEGLSATERDKQAANDGYEVEKPGKWGETCELQPNGTWDVDD